MAYFLYTCMQMIGMITNSMTKIKHFYLFSLIWNVSVYLMPSFTMFQLNLSGNLWSFLGIKKNRYASANVNVWYLVLWLWIMHILIQWNPWSVIRFAIVEHLTMVPDGNKLTHFHPTTTLKKQFIDSSWVSLSSFRRYSQANQKSKWFKIFNSGHATDKRIC